MAAAGLELTVVGEHGGNLATGVQVDSCGEVDGIKGPDLGRIDLDGALEPATTERD